MNVTIKLDVLVKYSTLHDDDDNNNNNNNHVLLGKKYSNISDCETD